MDYIGTSFEILMANVFYFLRYPIPLGIYRVSIFELSLCMTTFTVLMSQIARMFGKQDIV